MSRSCSLAENCSWSTSDTQFNITVISYRYCYPTIAVAGILASLLLLLTLRRACFQSADVYTYLRCLMSSDCAVLAMSGATMLADSLRPVAVCDNRTFLMRSEAQAVWRVAFLPLVNSLIVFSLGLQLWMTQDRYLAVCAPKRRPVHHRRLPLRVAATLLLALALHAPLVLGFQVVHHCPDGRHFYELTLSGSAAQYGRAWTAYQWTLQLLARWTPTGLLLYCNGYIIAAIRRRERRVSATLRPAAPSSKPDQTGSWQEPKPGELDQAGSGPGGTGQTGGRPGSGPGEPRVSVISDGIVQSSQHQPSRRHEADHRLELLLGAMGVSYLVTNCLQMALFIVQYVYDQRDINVQVCSNDKQVGLGILSEKLLRFSPAKHCWGITLKLARD